MALALNPSNDPAGVFRIPVRVYWEDTDASGVVYHGNYARFFERCRSDWLRAVHGLSQAELAEALGALIVVNRMVTQLSRPARLDDACWVTFAIERLKGASAQVVQTLVHQDSQTQLASCELTLVCLDAKSFRPMPFPARLRALLDGAAVTGVAA